jgi:glucokinase
MRTYFISGDIGGTKTLLRAAELKDGDVKVHCELRRVFELFGCTPGFSE